jgi:nickel-dependent lactate racemase
VLVQLPYGRDVLNYEFDNKSVKGILRGKMDDFIPSKSSQELVAESIENPFDSLPLRELAKGKKKIVLIASDHTRPVPSKLIVPEMLAQIRSGNPEADITILIATGCHRETTEQELKEKFGSDILNKEKIVIHDCDDEENLVTICKLPSGANLRINRLAAEADLLVAEGFIEPHFFAGFSGGRKSIYPGIASRTCVRHNHNSGFLDSPFARTGILEGNPIHEDMIYAAKAAKLKFIVNVVINSRKEVIASFAGDCEKAHIAGTKFVLENMGVKKQLADVVITTNNGYPMDQNLYQMVKGMCAAEATCKKGGVIIAVGKCEDGVGGDVFYRHFCDHSPEKLLEMFRKTLPEKTATDQWQSHILARILVNHSVVLLSDIDDKIVREMGMIPVKTMNQALDEAARALGKNDFTICIIPEGISVIVQEDL